MELHWQFSEEIKQKTLFLPVNGDLKLSAKWENKLMMQDGGKHLDKCVVGCILTAGYSHAFCRESQSCAGPLPADWSWC